MRRWALAAMLLAAQPTAAAGGFFASVSDLPLMAGLVERPEAALVFDKPGGRIVEAVAEGPVSAAAVERFYRTSLAELGWRAETGFVFHREGERLSIALDSAGPTLVARFTITPEGR